MAITDLPALSALRTRMQWHETRQRLLAENVANSDTPGFAPSDLKPFRAEAALAGAARAGGIAPAATNPLHMPGRVRPSAALRPQSAPDSEARLDGNQVVLEEEMMKLSDSRGAYDTAISLYQQSLTMLRIAARAPGR